MNNTYSCSYVEVLEILKHISEEDYKKIPKEKIDFYKNNMDKNYVYIYDPIEPKTLRKTKVILINLYKNYIANEDEKQKINQILKLNKAKEEQEKIEKYSLDDIFKKTDKDNDIKSAIPKNKTKTVLITNKKSFFTKFKNFIFKIIHINQ